MKFFKGYFEFLIWVFTGVIIAFIIMAITGAISLITANATPTSGVTKVLSHYQGGPAICDWQADILAIATSKEEINGRKNTNSANSGRDTTSVRYPGERHLTRCGGIFEGPSGKETYYNLSMGRVVQYMESLGYTFEYWIRSDGVKMYGPYIMCAADLSIRPKGTILETSLGTGIVCDTGEFVQNDRRQLDIAVDW